MNISKFFREFKALTCQVAVDAKELRNSVDRNTKEFLSDNYIYASNLMEQIETDIQDVNEELEHAESYSSMDTISFQELLQTCAQLYDQNDSWFSTIENRLEQYGYVKQNEKGKSQTDS